MERSGNVSIHGYGKVLYALQKSPYASRDVIARKKTDDIQLCVNYHKLNSIVVRDTFPMPQIDQAL